MALTKKQHAALYRVRHKIEINRKAKEAYKADPEHFSNAKRKSRYGLSPEQTKALLERAKCDCCGTDKPGSSKGWHIDHNHATGDVRGLLCWKCNLLLGQLGDTSEELIQSYNKLLKYLEEIAPQTKRLLSEITPDKV